MTDTVLAMFTPNRSRVPALLASALLLVAALVAAAAARPAARGNLRLTSSGPTNAGKVYRWGNSQWHDGFTEPVRRAWKVNRPRYVDNQHGMLTLNATAAPHTVSAEYTGHARRYGRWETRVRAMQYSHRHTPYRIVAELIPAGSRAYHCGGRNIELSSYRLGAHRAHFAARNRPDVQFTFAKRRDLGPRIFHTYAVEVTRRHISWFVDAHVVMTERRAAARSGEMFSVRFRMVAVKGHRMNPGRMQMDWIRYYTLARKNARSIDAPHAHRSVYRRAC